MNWHPSMTNRPKRVPCGLHDTKNPHCNLGSAVCGCHCDHCSDFLIFIETAAELSEEKWRAHWDHERDEG